MPAAGQHPVASDQSNSNLIKKMKLLVISVEYPVSFSGRELGSSNELPSALVPNSKPELINALAPRFLSELSGRLKTAQFGKLHVHYNEVW